MSDTFAEVLSGSGPMHSDSGRAGQDTFSAKKSYISSILGCIAVRLSAAASPLPSERQHTSSYFNQNSGFRAGLVPKKEITFYERRRMPCLEILSLIFERSW